MTDKLVCNGEVISSSQIKSLNCFISNSIATEELSIDTLSTDFITSCLLPTLFKPADADALVTSDDKLFCVQPLTWCIVTDPAAITYGAKVEWYRDDVLQAAFYRSGIRRIGKNMYAVSCISAIGLLDKETHYGGLYSNTRFDAIVADIIGDTVPYTIDPALAGVLLYGWLPKATKRENLHALLFATGISIRKDPDGNLHFTALSGENPAELGDDRIYLGGDVDYVGQATKVSVTEHSYAAFSTDEVVTLFDGEAAGAALVSPQGVARTGVLVTFSGPMHDLTVTGGTILESGVNYAVLGPAANCTLKGKAYTHTTRVITKVKPTTLATVDQTQNEVSVSDNTLISALNSENVAARVMSYYGNARVTSCDMVVGTERPGDAVAYNDPFDTHESGFVKSMDITLSNVLKAAVELVAGYTPVGIGNYYSNRIVLTADGTFTVPADCKGKIRAVLISGGRGGWSGGKGKDTEEVANIRESSHPQVDPQINYTGYCASIGGDGGDAGLGGEGGKIMVVDIDVSVGQSFAVRIGSGGAGGVYSADGSVVGSLGSASTLGAYTSEDGTTSVNGYVDPITGDVYAASGEVGISGGKGGGGNGIENSLDYVLGPVIVGRDGTQYQPGANPTNADHVEKDSPRNSFNGGLIAHANSGAGGGAAVGGTAGLGEKGSASTGYIGTPTTTEEIIGYAYAGIGGKGADASPPPAQTRYGFGGIGGNGGGGAGGSGYAYIETWRSSSATNPVQTTGETRRVLQSNGGGAGSNGGVGAQGIIIIYY